MSYTFLLDAGEESSAESFSTIPACALSKSTHTVEKFYSNDSGMLCYQDSRSGTTCETLTPDRGEIRLMSSARDFHVKDTQSSGKSTKAQDSMDGLTPFALFEKSSHSQSGWKTCQQFLPGLGDESSLNFPTWGMMLGGACFQGAPLVPHIHENACFAWRTPAASDSKRRCLDWPSVRKPGNPLCLPQQIAQRGVHGYLNPQFINALMGWPNTWSLLTPLETAKFQQWLNSHGKP